jgi:hypothetical protein
MIEAIRRFLNSNAGKSVGLIVALLCVGLCVFMMHNVFGRSEAAAMANDRMFVDSETGKSFKHTLAVGEPMPCMAPSGKMTGYPSEVCWWNADGSASSTPTYVILNSLMGKSGPTFCPVCHRLVVVHNPPPHTGGQPPPTEDEFKQMHSTQ